MFLSDELLEIGRASNPKNNKSMAEAMCKIIATINKKLPVNTKDIKTVQKYNALMNFVLSTLDKEGYKYFGKVLAEAEGAGTKEVAKLTNTQNLN